MANGMDRLYFGRGERGRLGGDEARGTQSGGASENGRSVCYPTKI
jgi:hypothetical protein